VKGRLEEVSGESKRGNFIIRRSHFVEIISRKYLNPIIVYKISGIMAIAKTGTVLELNRHISSEE
jgi:hypothetical protein